jgi:hypothetical protein
MMPHNWEYVAAAYAFWAILLLAYVMRLARRSRAVSRVLERLDSAKN